MQVIKRDGKKQNVQFDKITSRLNKLCYGLDQQHVDPVQVAVKVIEGIYDGVTTSELDTLAAEIAATMAAKHPDYALLASRIAVSNLQKNTLKSFSETVDRLYRYVDVKSGRPAPLVSKELHEIVMDNAERLDSALIYDRDFSFDYFGYKTLERSYLLKRNGVVAERPQHLFMRVALGIHKRDIDRALETYQLMSEKAFIHATPTLFNAGTPNPQMSSCFLLQIKEDSIDGIFDTLKDCAKISQSAGGIGLSIHNVRATGSYIRGTGGTSNGILPMLRVFNDTARYVDQGGGKRKGSFAIYLEPWHADVELFLELRKNHGKEEQRARDLFTALWVPDLFMRRVEEDKEWSLFCPNEAPGLSEVWGEAFEALYLRYETEGRARKRVRAQELWGRILESQMETGSPYLLYKDACNSKSNQQNLGTIKSSNLCAEILEYTAPDEIAVCNLASIALPQCVRNGAFDFQALHDVAKVVTRNLNRVIDENSYPLEAARRSNLRHRPVGLGVQGLADVFILLKMPFDSDRALQLNREIFETLYFAAVSASCELAEEEGPYETFAGSPASRGELQCDLWGERPSERWDFDSLRHRVKKQGLRNSLLIALMPTASTSQILGNNECFEPYTTNIYSRRVLSGEFIVVNKHLMTDLADRGLWDEGMKNEILRHNGSVQNIARIPSDIKELYKTVWEIKQKSLIDMARARAPFICQTQSLNLFLESPTFGKLSSMHFYAWKQGLKTGIYYLRTKSAAEAIKFTVAEPAQEACSLTEGCLTCSA